ncbi:hypothetical protein Lepto7375DRAFT_3902 [Leptolyngbya sp. PCC 7375]|nr:hypothetical protein Lepto7375DRAFT_3902 [Leptolyngbya sp. PCC 7375]
MVPRQIKASRWREIPRTVDNAELNTGDLKVMALTVHQKANVCLNSG